MNLNDFIGDFAYKFREFKLLKKILKKPYVFFMERNERKMVRVFKKYGHEALFLFDDCLRKHNIPYTLAFGTLLGAIREHDFIPYDDDIDVSMSIEDYTPDLIINLASYGIKLKHTFTVDEGNWGREDSFEYKGVQIDIFYFYKTKEGNTYCCDFVGQPGCATRTSSIKKFGGLLPRRLFMPYEKKISYVDFFNRQMPIPANYKDILIKRYGADYMTPKPGWRPETDYIIPEPSKIGIYKEF